MSTHWQAPPHPALIISPKANRNTHNTNQNPVRTTGSSSSSVATFPRLRPTGGATRRLYASSASTEKVPPTTGRATNMGLGYPPVVALYRSVKALFVVV